MKVTIPYGVTKLTLSLDAGLQVQILQTGNGREAVPASPNRLVGEAMASPIGSPPLRELARHKRDAVIICSDHTRPVPSRQIIPPMLRELREGNPSIHITLLIATGAHRATTRDELAQKLGGDIVSREHIAVHDCCAREELCLLGVLPSGAPLVISKLAAQTELLLAEGFIEPHFFAGYSGGCKSVLPGVCGRQTVLGNHCAAFIDSPLARAGILNGNPIQADMTAAAKMAGLRFIVNVVLDGEKRIAAVFAGDAFCAHAAGCSHLDSLCRVRATAPGDIVVTSNGGAPLDQNLYQAVKGLSTAEAAAAPGAVLVICAACADGIGGESFHHMLRDCESPGQLLRAIRGVPANRTQPDQWQVQVLARILEKHRVIVVCDPPVRAAVREMKMEAAGSLDEAVAAALAEKGRHARIVVIPDGVSVVAGT